MPMPLSRTDTRTHGPPSAPGSGAAKTRTSPRSVNFTALPTRLCRIWRSRAASPTVVSGRSAVQCESRSTPLASAWAENTSAASWMASCRSKRSCATRMRPAPSLEKSSTSSTSASSAAELRRSTESIWRWPSSRRVPRSSSLAPTMPCSGVRISWLMLARKRLFTALASRAAASAACSSRSTWRRQCRPRPTTTTMQLPDTVAAMKRCVSPLGASGGIQPRERSTCSSTISATITTAIAAPLRSAPPCSASTGPSGSHQIAEPAMPPCATASADTAVNTSQHMPAVALAWPPLRRAQASEPSAHSRPKPDTAATAKAAFEGGRVSSHARYIRQEEPTSATASRCTRRASVRSSSAAASCSGPMCAAAMGPGMLISPRC